VVERRIVVVCPSKGLNKEHHRRQQEQCETRFPQHIRADALFYAFGGSLN
jgi:hypothetical protein